MEVNRESFFNSIIKIKDIGSKGLRKLSKSNVAVVGMGGLGTHLSLYLILSGIGRLKIIDPGIIRYKNLYKQILYTSSDVGYFKVEVAKKRLAKYSRYTKIDIFPMMVTPWNIDRIFRNVDIILDGTDNIYSKILINRYSVKNRVPYIPTIVENYSIKLTLIDPPSTPCLECFYKNLEYLDKAHAMETSISTAASIAVSEAIKYLAGLETSLKSKLLTIDLKDISIDKKTLHKDPECPACSNIVSYDIGVDFNLFWNYEELIFNPRDRVRLDLEALTREIASKYILIRRGEVGLSFKYNKNIMIGVSYSGNVIVIGRLKKDIAVNIVRELVDNIYVKYVVD